MIYYTGTEQDVVMLGPLTHKHFTIRRLADSIADLTDLVLLYPNKPKDEVFKKHYTPQKVSQNGYPYKRLELINVVEG